MTVEERELDDRWKKYDVIMQEHADNWKHNKQDALEMANDEFIQQRRKKEKAGETEPEDLMIKDGNSRVGHVTSEQLAHDGGCSHNILHSEYLPCGAVFFLLLVIMLCVTENACSKRGKSVFTSGDQFCLA
jgi:hypothetical protein